MRIQCDVCEKEEATTFCSADEAALCHACDTRVHLANKLAGMHPRYSLLPPTTSEESPLCDICLERRALLFCQEDRAILCHECDLPIHGSNEHTRKHSRFLLTGVKLSSSESPRVGSSAPSSSSSGSDRKETQSPPSNSSSAKRHGQALSLHTADNPWSNDAGSVSTSSMPGYLMEGLSGWHMDDLLDTPAAAVSYYDEPRFS
ncbi:hypothetical protein MLD38_023020 [Melastoma candidum]|uniref:Uncharacterized protein n=1 Tax=Melastoma candidum TaxID=119954 RepID=A0ACB9QKC0_9MYRT|nr:hypothetical protein MLD38_023020 [Melastoma candidum]